MAAKKLLTGCLVLVLILALGAMLAWMFVLRPMWDAGSDIVSGARDWATTLDLGDDIENQSAYAPPADGRLTPAQVDAFVAVQSVVAREMGADLAAVAQRMRAVEDRQARGEGSLQDVATAYREVSALASKLRASQAQGVNEVGLSRHEYAFIRRQALAALPQLVDVGSLPDFPGVPGFPAADPDDAAAMAAARDNAALLRPHLPLLQRTLGAGVASAGPQADRDDPQLERDYPQVELDHPQVAPEGPQPEYPEQD